MAIGGILEAQFCQDCSLFAFGPETSLLDHPGRLCRFPESMAYRMTSSLKRRPQKRFHTVDVEEYLILSARKLQIPKLAIPKSSRRTPPGDLGRLPPARRRAAEKSVEFCGPASSQLKFLELSSKLNSSRTFKTFPSPSSRAVAASRPASRTLDSTAL
jgi:hypothetical protein